MSDQTTPHFIAYVLNNHSGVAGIRAMTGGKCFSIAEGEGLRLADLKNSKFNFVDILYNKGTDLFDIEFIKTRKFDIVKQETVFGVYAEDMKKLVEEKTGLRMSF